MAEVNHMCNPIFAQKGMFLKHNFCSTGVAVLGAPAEPGRLAGISTLVGSDGRSTTISENMAFLVLVIAQPETKTMSTLI